MTESTYGPAPEVPLHEVEWRIDGEPFQGNDGWRARFVPYLDARWCARALDQWVGAQNWKRSNVPLVFRGTEIVECFISIRFPDEEYGLSGGSEWVEKSDVGLIEGGGQTGIKGTYSDAFKRSASGAWGVGRNVYGLPGDIWAEVTVKMDREGKPKTNKNGKILCREATGARLQIRAELEKRGHEILEVGKEIKIGDGSSDHDTTADAAEPLSADQVDGIRALFAPLAGETLKTAQAALFRTWGKVADVPAERYDDIVAEAREIVATHTPDPSPQPTPEATEAPADLTGEAQEQAPESDTPPSTPEPALTADEVEKMTAKTLAEELDRYGLELTGNMATKKARLLAAMAGNPAEIITLEAWQNGAEAPAHPETGEKLWSIEKYMDGIARYEETLDDTDAWEQWLGDQPAATNWPGLNQWQAFTIYNAIHQFHTKGTLPDA